ncbi:MAG: hypothetical protein GXY83_36765 [Rhodopirellula sp.]|nr:hypothetical protein [Rhodopirellula sp.]
MYSDPELNECFDLGEVVAAWDFGPAPDCQQQVERHGANMARFQELQTAHGAKAISAFLEGYRTRCQCYANERDGAREKLVAGFSMSS